ncbi:quinoprotein dehydrogenase-associated putative ABC transporter substrate-binding protein [Massilia sp. YIM B02443]|uniref:quinoprotein dehydrogenase-associated putative ABC transporter substrate-binding protein n=1 Tax=Massilia sp. YIM B02443 TaxID=3050127 RepID=UPI0025B70E68|nr:quinoprotein dehydrogenase-associated putative ABC transporter substrate-binding protein [Massilia sp. YIM B02443]MDN4040114.1 quinoprotein dehydrogenase-associated putative ABC transporter substrate-binding protein [Massilia sp. YIM B02443]
MTIRVHGKTGCALAGTVRRACACLMAGLAWLVLPAVAQSQAQPSAQSPAQSPNQAPAQTPAQSPPEASGPGSDKVLRVCQDPNNLPFSHRSQSGFENKIAALFAQELGWELETTWFPQRIGFIRNTLRAKREHSDEFKCDLVTGVPAGFEMAATTHPYYHSSYALAYVKGRGKGLDGVRGLDDVLALTPEQRRKLRFGVFTASPLTDWLLQHHFMEQVDWYQIQSGDAEQYPGEIIERDLASGKIDLAFVWGPIAGYFARTTRTAPIVAVTLRSRPGMKLDYDIAMGVRHADKAFRQQIDGLISANQGKINAILEEYGVPLLDQQGQQLRTSQRSGKP